MKGSNLRYRGMRLALAGWLLGACALLSGCVTIADRIEQNQVLFDRLNPTQQAMLRRGEVRIGYSPEMAYIALGRADEIREVTTAKGRSEVWLYQYSYPVYLGEQFSGYRPHFVHTRKGYRVVHLPTFIDRYRYETKDYLRLQFRNRKLSRIERIR